FRVGVVQQVADPLVGAVVRRRKLGHRERLADALAELRDDELDLADQLDVAAAVGAYGFDSAVSVLPLLACELDVHGHPVQQESGQSDGSSCRMRSPSA